jgi:hypothetical protein
MTAPAPDYAVAETLHRWAVDTLAACVKRGWRTDWSARGCYLHLEVSELIEACRGKGDSSKEEEAADVMLVYLSLCGAYRINMTGVLAILNQKLNGILAGTIGAGPEAP